MYIYFDTNGTIKEIVNDKSIRQGSTEANKIYCYIEGNPTIDDIWYMQKLPSGETSNEVSFKNSTVTKAIPYDAKRDMRYFKDFEQYTFYVFTLNAFLVSQKGLNLATIRIVVDNEIFALGELTFNVQENVINVDNGITISQYDYLLLAYASRTLNEVTANDLDALLDDKINAKIGDLANGSPKVFDTEANIEAMHDDEGIAVATDTGDIWVWNDTQQEYQNTGLLYVGDISLYYTKTESDNRYAQLGANNTFTGDNEFRGDSLFSDDINQAYGDFSTQGNVEAQSFTKNGTNLDDIYASKSNTYTKTETDTLLNNKADKSTTYTKTETDTLLNAKADKTNTYTKSQVDTALNDKVNTSDFDTLDGRVDDIEDDIDTLKSVQNVVDIVATYSALQSYDTSDLGTNDKIQVIADETHSGASTIYNWNGSAWQYVGAYGGNSYTKAQTDTLLDGKADKSTTYTKTEIDTILNTVVIEKSFESLAVDQMTITGYVTQEVLNSIGQRTQVKLRVYDSSNDITFILAPNFTPETNVYNFKCTVNSPIDADGMIEAEGAISIDREYSFVLRNIKIYTESETLEQIDLHKLVNKTYSELATLKSGNNLVAGQLYRITDYVTKTNGLCNGISNDARSMEHPFDIVLRAISSNKFSENARALLHSGDTYFANSNLNSWQLWYCFDNDDVRFEWADTLTGKGVIYRMIDEFGNDLPYDFKNIQFKRYKITGTSDQRQSNAIGKYLGFYGNYSCVSDKTDYEWYFTFTKRSDKSDLSLVAIEESTIENSYYVKQVTIGEYLTDIPNYRGKQALNNIVIESSNIIVNIEMGKGSHHNTWIGNQDITYSYFKEMCRNNILYGEVMHTRADECFEQNMLGDFTNLGTYASCWNKFSHHFNSNTSISMQSNDFEAQCGSCKFPNSFSRNHVAGMWGSVNAGTHNTFNRCEFGYMANVTLSGTGTWDGVENVMCWNCTIKITNLFGSKLGRMEYVSISEGANNYNILNLTVGAIYGASDKVLTIALADLNSYELQTSSEKKLDFALDTVNNVKAVTYVSRTITSENIEDGYYLKGTISTVDGTVTWAELTSLSNKFAEVKAYTDNAIQNSINILRWELGSHTLDVESDTDTKYLKNVPSGAIGCQINKVGGMSYKCLNLANASLFEIGAINLSTGGDDPRNNRMRSNYIEVKPNTQYTLKWDGADVNYVLYDENKGKIYNAIGGTLTTTTTTKYIRFYAGLITTSTQIMLNEGSTALPYEPYFSGIRDSAATSVVSKDSSDNTIATLTIPSAIQNLTGYGWGINDTCYNYIDFDRKVFVQKVGRVDLGIFAYTYDSQNKRFATTISDAKTNGTTRLTQFLCDKYTCLYNGETFDSNWNMVSYVGASNEFYFHNLSYTDATTFKSAMNGVYLYYELATTVEIDISAYLTTDTIDVEPNGNLEFTNTYNNDVPSDIDYLIEEVKA